MLGVFILPEIYKVMFKKEKIQEENKKEVK